jgi:hypothetical protein
LYLTLTRGFISSAEFPVRINVNENKDNSMIPRDYVCFE